MQPQKIANLAGHKDCIYSVISAQDNRYCFSADGKGQIAQWDLTNPELGTLVVQVPSSVYSMCALPTTEELIIGQNFAGLHQVNYAQKKETRSLQLTDSYIFDIRLWEDILLVALGDGVLAIVDLQEWTVRKHIKASEKNARCIALNPIKEEFAVGYSDNCIRIFAGKTAELVQTIEAHQNSVFTLAYSPDGKYLLSGSRDAHLKIWDTTQNYDLHQSIVAHLFAINKITYSPDKQYFATASMDKSVKIWDAHTFKLLKVLDRARHAGHGNSVNTLLWTDFNNYLLSAGDDRMVGVWEIL
jgi:WD40 repeat protein